MKAPPKNRTGFSIISLERATKRKEAQMIIGVPDQLVERLIGHAMGVPSGIKKIWIQWEE